MFAKSALVLTFAALAGCSVPGAIKNFVAGGPPARPGTDPEAPAHVRENLARLQALDVFTVGQLVVEPSAAPIACTGLCPGAEAAVNAAQTRQAIRLAELADAAEKAAASPLPDACAEAAVAANLEALSALRIVGVSGLVVTPPAGSSQACARAGKLAAIAAAARGL